MSAQAPEELIERHEAFLHCRPVDRPLVGYWCGGYFPAEQFPRGTSQWAPEQVLLPEEVSFAAFAADYESLFRLHRDVDDDFFFGGTEGREQRDRALIATCARGLSGYLLRPWPG